MLNRSCEPTRWCIAHELALSFAHGSALGFARWAGRKGTGTEVDMTLSAFKTVLNSLEFGALFDRERGPIDHEEFLGWHELAVGTLQKRIPLLSYGWAAKMIAVYLKVTCYTAGFGRDGLHCVIHPPLDGILRTALSKRHWKTEGLQEALRAAARPPIICIDADVYTRIIHHFVYAACERNCTLFELEQFWSP